MVESPLDKAHAIGYLYVNFNRECYMNVGELIVFLQTQRRSAEVFVKAFHGSGYEEIGRISVLNDTFSDGRPSPIYLRTESDNEPFCSGRDIFPDPPCKCCGK